MAVCTCCHSLVILHGGILKIEVDLVSQNKNDKLTFIIEIITVIECN